MKQTEALAYEILRLLDQQELYTLDDLATHGDVPSAELGTALTKAAKACSTHEVAGVRGVFMGSSATMRAVLSQHGFTHDQAEFDEALAFLRNNSLIIQVGRGRGRAFLVVKATEAHATSPQIDDVIAKMNELRNDIFADRVLEAGIIGVRLNEIANEVSNVFAAMSLQLHEQTTLIGQLEERLSLTEATTW